MDEWGLHLESQGVLAADFELDMIMYLLDENTDGFIEKSELAAYAKGIDTKYPEEAPALSLVTKKVQEEDHDTFQWNDRDREQYYKGYEDSRVEMAFEFFDDDHNQVLFRAEFKELLAEWV